MTVVLWVSVGVLFYIYAGYRLLLQLIVTVRGPRPIRTGDETPRVSLVISAYNEDSVIRAKLENTLALDYPEDRLEIVVVSDASTDDTDDIVKGFAPRVRLERQRHRLGKTAGLNQVLPTLTGDIVVFSDANAMYQPDAVRMLVRNFGDPAVGCVTGESRYVGGQGTGAGSRRACLLGVRDDPQAARDGGRIHGGWRRGHLCHSAAVVDPASTDGHQ